jgi:hypothetical protein
MNHKELCNSYIFVSVGNVCFCKESYYELRKKLDVIWRDFLCDLKENLYKLSPQKYDTVEPLVYAPLTYASIIKTSYLCKFFSVPGY